MLTGPSDDGTAREGVPGPAAPVGPRRAGVTGSPISHSLSPVLHRAAYAALGLDGWTYEAIEVPAGGLGPFVHGLGPEWVGLSVTMPGKEEALALADEVSSPARLTGAANTLVRDGGRWLADNTDVHGLRTALLEAGLTPPGADGTPLVATVLGAGATARSALVALCELGVQDVTLVVRDQPRPETLALAERLGLTPHTRRLADGPLDLDRTAQDVLLGTLPGTAAAPQVRLGTGAGAAVVMDVAYAPWPSPLATAVRAIGPLAPSVAGGTGMLLHQAVRQVSLMTGHDGPVEAMRAALRAAGDGDG